MKLFIDSAKLADIEQALERGFVSGITTNPTLVAREQSTIEQTMSDILALLARYPDNGWRMPISVELVVTEPEEVLRQALRLKDMCAGRHGLLYVKVPIGWDELRLIRLLRAENILVNCTAVMSYNQAIMAANAGANYVSLFWGRIRDTGQDAATVVRQVHETFKEWSSPAEIVVGSIRQMIDVNEAMQAGADIVTVPPQFLPLLCRHPKTDEAVGQFMRDAGALITT